MSRGFHQCGYRPMVELLRYVAGAGRALEEAKAQGWTVVSIRRDWATVFNDAAVSAAG